MKLAELIQRLSSKQREGVPEDFETFLEEFVPNTLTKSRTLQEAFALSAYDLEGVYQEGFSHYAAENFSAAHTAFHWLVLLNPYITRYWMGLAATHQMRNHYDKALRCYAITSLLNDKDPLPHFHAYGCYEALGEPKEGHKALKLALVRCDDDPELKEEVEGLLSGSE